MSKKGIEIASKAFSALQEYNRQLLELGCSKKLLGTKEGNQDIALGQMLNIGKDSMKYKFIDLTQGKWMEQEDVQRKKALKFFIATGICTKKGNLKRIYK